MCVLDDEPFLRSEHLVGDEEGADDIVRHASARVADHMRIALCQSRKLGRIESAVHTGDNGDVSRRMVRQPPFVAEFLDVTRVCRMDCFYILVHQIIPFL